MRTEQEAAPKGTEPRQERAEAPLPHDFEAWYVEYQSDVYRYVRFRVATRESAWMRE